jgi:hypothetical protein
VRGGARLPWPPSVYLSDSSFFPIVQVISARRIAPWQIFATIEESPSGTPFAEYVAYPPIGGFPVYYGRACRNIIVDCVIGSCHPVSVRNTETNRQYWWISNQQSLRILLLLRFQKTLRLRSGLRHQSLW